MFVCQKGTLFRGLKLSFRAKKRKERKERRRKRKESERGKTESGSRHVQAKFTALLAGVWIVVCLYGIMGLCYSFSFFSCFFSFLILLLDNLLNLGVTASFYNPLNVSRRMRGVGGCVVTILWVFLFFSSCFLFFFLLFFYCSLVDLSISSFCWFIISFLRSLMPCLNYMSSALTSLCNVMGGACRLGGSLNYFSRNLPTYLGRRTRWSGF